MNIEPAVAAQVLRDAAKRAKESPGIYDLSDTAEWLGYEAERIELLDSPHQISEESVAVWYVYIEDGVGWSSGWHDAVDEAHARVLSKNWATRFGGKSGAIEKRITTTRTERVTQ